MVRNPIRIATELKVLPSALSLDGLHEFCDGLACHLQDTTGAAPLMFIVSDGTDTVYLMEAVWRSDQEQQIGLDIMRGMMQALPEIERYSFIYEAWMGLQAAMPDVRDPAFVYPRNRPDRQECLGIDTYERTGGHRKTIYRMNRDPVARTFTRTKMDVDGLTTLYESMKLFPDNEARN